MEPGARCGPQGAENRPGTRGQIYHFILPKVCPVRGPARNLSSSMVGGLWGCAFVVCGRGRTAGSLENGLRSPLCTVWAAQ